MIGEPASEVSDADSRRSHGDVEALRGPGVVVDGSDAAAVRDGGARRLSALIVDWGGVLTAPLDSAMTTWASSEGIDFTHFVDVMRRWVGSSGSSPVVSGGSGSDDAAGTAETAEDAAGLRGAHGPEADRSGEADRDRDGERAGAGDLDIDGDRALDGDLDRDAGRDGDGDRHGDGDRAADAGRVAHRDAERGADAGRAADVRHPGDAAGEGRAGEAADPQAALGEPPRDPAADPGVLAELESAARRGLVPASPVHALERGEIGIEDFERLLADALRERGSAVQAEGLLTRVLSGLAELRDDMLGLVRRARSSGIRTALLSNSWGDANYPEEEWEGAFDVVVISGRVGMRKPDEEIFRHTADLLGVPADECVMVDDLAGNVRGAVAAGMVGVLHSSYEETAEELEILFDRRLR